MFRENKDIFIHAKTQTFYPPIYSQEACGGYFPPYKGRNQEKGGHGPGNRENLTQRRGNGDSQDTIWVAGLNSLKQKNRRYQEDWPPKINFMGLDKVSNYALRLQYNFKFEEFENNCQQAQRKICK